MFLSMRHLLGYTISATDGNIGTAHDFLFDDREWIVRYLVVDTGDWLPGRKVLLHPLTFGQPNYVGKIFPVEETREQIEKSPPLDTDKPVSRQHEHQLHLHYAWPLYGGAELLGSPASESEEKERPPEGDSHLRSFKEVSGYGIEATDGQIGQLHDLIVEVEKWRLRYLVIDTKKWLRGRRVLVAPDWAKEISWAERRVVIDLTRDQIRESPEFDPNEPVNRQYEEKLYDYYGRPQYWTED